MKNRVKNEGILNKIMSAEEAASLVENGMIIGFSGFTAVAYPKAFPMALAKRVQAGENLKISMITGASVGDELDGSLARAGIIERRYPYQTNKSIRELINSGDIQYVDMHLSRVPFWIKNNYFGKIDLAVIEASSIDENGNIIPTVSVGCSDTLVKYADRVIVEINTRIPVEIEGMHDIYTGQRAPHTEPIPLTATSDRIGTPYIPCDPDKIAAVIFCDIPDGNSELAPADSTMQAIAEHLIAFLEQEVKENRMPLPLPPLQSGVGGVANAVLSCLEKSDFEDLTVYTEVMQDAVLRLLDSGKVKAVSATAMTISPSMKDEVYSKISQYKEKIVLRPEEISNSPEVIHRLSLIAMNTALEVDLSGNVNSTHVNGVRIMNGIGGSGDFARNAGLTVFTTASTAKNGTLSCIVPAVSHVDHTEHDVDVIVTEYGAADLRGLTAYERAEVLIEKCAHPDFRPELRAFLSDAKESSMAKHGLPSPSSLW